MRIFNQDKTLELTEYDESKGYLREDFLDAPQESIEECVERMRKEGRNVFFYSHFWAEESGGHIARIDFPATEKILVFVPYTEEELYERETADLRKKRETECFAVVNRVKLWYDALSIAQLSELEEWYHAWLNVTETRVIPEIPDWVNNKIITEVI